MHPIIKLIFLPSNAPALLQPIDQGIIQAVKLYYIRRTSSNAPALLQPIDQGIIQAVKLYYIRRTSKIILNTMDCDPDMNVMQCWQKFDIALCIVYIKESLQEVKPCPLKSCSKKLWPDLTVGGDKESVQIQILAEDIVQVSNNIRRNGFEQIQSGDTQELLESQDEDLTETDLEEMLNLHFIEDEELLTNTYKTTLNVKPLPDAK
ncbi:DDE superfamily endonuclease [Popillia japonica]|uniref:DDE superfamily endonuclease n=1 Tax=Popillia japonica TaxID=7064 RepID=A0AAW1KNQ3_POPJA